MPNIEAKINSNLLKWARESFNKSKSEVASRLKVSEEFIDKIENGDAKVSIPQLRDLANVYKRPLAAFFFQKFLRIKLLDTFSKPKDM
ncbi:MAG TPA: helix-turn-helix transcriptional regulator [Candidatus Nanoarchaeia archaeon]